MHRPIVLSFVLPLMLAAQDRPPLTPPACMPTFDGVGRAPCPSGALVVRTASRAVLTIEGRVVRYEITERFVNRGRVAGETDYLLPLPARAVFEDLALSINGEMVTGETMHADRARAIYEEIVRRQRDPALVEWMGQGLLRTRIFPIAPGEEKTVVVRFRAVAEREGDALRIDYRPPTRAGDDAVHSSVEVRYAAHGELGKAFSPTHDVETGEQGALQFARATSVRGVLTLLVPVRSAHTASLHVLTHANAREDGFVMITIAPPPVSRAVTPRDITFVMDVSGSMAGTKLEQARKAGRALLESLRPTDRFRVIAFSTDVNAFREGWQAATTPNVRAAQQFLESLSAGGSTNISDALEDALRASDANERLPLVLFLTDGEPTVGERNPERIAALAQRLRGRQRVFTFGVGTDVNAALLEQLALSGRGTAQFVRPDENVERAVGLVAQRLTSPVATDVTVHVEGVRLDRVQPIGALDLFAGQEATLFARYHGGRRGATVTVSGVGADGPVRWTTTADFTGRIEENAFVARLWAMQRVGWLSAERRRNGGNAELDDELRSLGTRYGIPTELTSYLVTEPGLQLGGFANNAPVRDRRSMMPMSAPVGGVASALPPPSARAFEAAKAAAEQRAVSTMAQADRLQAAEGSDPQLTRRFAMGRSFTLQSGVWKDAPPDGAVPAALPRVVRVQAYSEAYFALLARLPQLQAAFALGERVSVQGRLVTLVLDPAGETTLNESRLDAIVRDW